jgi:hypothetical protein
MTMRPLCGAIVAAGALIGLGLTAIGIGMRYQGMRELNERTQVHIGATSLMAVLFMVAAGLVVGLGIAFIGLAYHHEKRERERLRELGHAPGARVTS